MSNRLSSIALRQKNSFARDVVFSVAIAIAAIVSATSVSTAVTAASSHTGTTASLVALR